MNAIEFIGDISEGIIKTPEILRNVTDKSVKIIVFTNDEWLEKEKQLQNQLWNNLFVYFTAFIKGDITLGQLAATFGIDKISAMQLLGKLNVPIADYDLDEDLHTINFNNKTESQSYN